MTRYRVSAGRKREPAIELLVRFGAAVAVLLPPVLLLMAAGCAPTIDDDARLAGIGTARAANSKITAAAAPAPRFSQARFVTADGERLPLRVWLPAGLIPDGVRAVVLALHGFNDYGNAFAMPAAVWAEHGIATYAYDQRGFGEAPSRGLWPGRAPLAADVATASRLLRRLYPGRPIYLLGESMGAAVAIVAMTGEAGMPLPDVDGVILCAPAVWGRPTMDLVPRLALFAGARLFPALTLTGRGLGLMPSDNMPMLRALARDPLVLKETRIDAVFGLVDLMDAALAAAPRLDLPLLLQYGARDDIMPAYAVREFVEALPKHPVRARRLVYYRDGYHLLLRDLEGAAVARDIALWMLDRAANLPSGEDSAQQQHQHPWPPRRVDRD